LDAVPGVERGLRSGVCVPVRIDDRLAGVFALFARRPRAYSTRDLTAAQRLASYLALGLAHQRLAEEARDAAVERERAVGIESSVELLRAIADVLDIRTVFPRVSDIANKMLPHDALTMAFFDENGRMVVEAASTRDFPEVQSRLLGPPPTPERIIADLTVDALPDPDVRERLFAAGYRALLSIRAKARDQMMHVGFFSKRPHAFGQRDVPIA